MDRFIYRGTEKLRCGYTTGTCAAAAASDVAACEVQIGVCFDATA